MHMNLAIRSVRHKSGKARWCESGVVWDTWNVLLKTQCALLTFDDDYRSVAMATERYRSHGDREYLSVYIVYKNIYIYRTTIIPKKEAYI